MARTKRLFVDSGEMRAVAEQLKKKYPELLFRANLEHVYFAFCISDKAKNARSSVIRTAISNPLPGMVTTKQYQIAIYRDDWEDWSDAKRHAILLEQLMYIDDDGKYLKPTISELYEFVATWGPNWRDDEMLPDVLEETVEFERKPQTEEEELASREKMDPVLRGILEEQDRKKKALADLAARKASVGGTETVDRDAEDEETIGEF